MLGSSPRRTLATSTNPFGIPAFGPPVATPPYLPLPTDPTSTGLPRGPFDTIYHGGNAEPGPPIEATDTPPPLGANLLAPAAKRGVGDIVADFVLNYGAASGNQMALNALQQRATQRRQASEWQRDDQRRSQDHVWDVEKEQRKANEPRYFASGRDQVKLDPVTGQSTVVYDGPEDFQIYANSLGLQPDTPEYADALRDHVLRANGPTALAGRVSLEGVRQEDRQELEGIRQGNRQALRSTPTYAQTHPRGRGMMGGGGAPRSPAAVIAPIVAKMASGQRLAPGEQQALDYYRRPAGGTRGRSAGGSEAGAPRISSQADYARLPKGAAYTAPDGSRRVKN